MISTFSAINATVLGSGRVNFDIAKDDELPKYFSNSLWGKPVGFLITAILAIALVNTIDLESISTAGSSGFLLIFTIVNYIGYKKYKTLKSNKFIHLFAAIICAIAFATLLLQQFEENKIGVFSALSIIVLSFLVEFVYKNTSKV